jgi:hypothetical protein
MKRMILILCILFLASCSSGFRHDLPVRESYVRVELGDQVPACIELTEQADLADGYLLAGVAAEHEWKYSTGANEWALYLLDAEGAVVAKCYQVDGEEVTLLPFHIRRISEADWSWVIRPGATDRCVEARDIFARLRYETFGWSVGSYDLEAMSDDGVGPISAEPVLALAQQEGAWIQDRFDFKKKVEFDRDAPVLERSVRYRLVSEGAIASMAEQRLLLFSGTQWTAMGWTQAIRDGELP